jgi:hypothetical protein
VKGTEAGKGIAPDVDVSWRRDTNGTLERSCLLIVEVGSLHRDVKELRGLFGRYFEMEPLLQFGVALSYDLTWLGDHDDQFGLAVVLYQRAPGGVRVHSRWCCGSRPLVPEVVQEWRIVIGGRDELCPPVTSFSRSESPVITLPLLEVLRDTSEAHGVTPDDVIEVDITDMLVEATPEIALALRQREAALTAVEVALGHRKASFTNFSKVKRWRDPLIALKAKLESAKPAFAMRRCEHCMNIVEQLLGPQA